MEVATSKMIAAGRQRRPLLPLQFLALLPAVGVIALIGSMASGVGLIAIIRMVQQHLRKTHEISRRFSRRLSRDLSHSVLNILPRKVNLPWGKVVMALVSCYAGRRFQRALNQSLALMNPFEEKVEEQLSEKYSSAGNKPLWGKGFSRSPPATVWRPYLLEQKSALENLREIHGLLGIVDRKQEELTMDQLIEGVRRILCLKYMELLQQSDEYWSHHQAKSIALALASECGLPLPLPDGGMEECASFGSDLIIERLFPCPKWLQLSQRVPLASLRLVFQNVWSWSSYYVETPFGQLHVYDTCFPGEGAAPPRDGHPPLLLQHGAFVTGWSMTLLGWLLSRRGRRVIMPDLFDFDNGLSASNLSGGAKVRSHHEHLEALVCVVRKASANGTQMLDIAGHSYGGFLAPFLAERCLKEGMPIRKVVMICPGGPSNIMFNHPLIVRFLQQPLETIDKMKPWFVPGVFAQTMVKVGLSVMLSPNNVNFLLSNDPSNYHWNNANNWGTALPSLVVWGADDTIAHPRGPPFLGQFLRQCFPNVDGFWVQRGGHNIHVFSAVAVARVMDAWLDSGVEEIDRQFYFPAEMLLSFTNQHVYPMDIPDARSVQKLPDTHLHSKL